MKLPRNWKEKIKLNYEYHNMKELAADLGVEIKPQSSDGQILRRNLEKHFYVTFLPSPNGSKTSHRFIVTGRRTDAVNLMKLTDEELELIMQLRNEK